MWQHRLTSRPWLRVSVIAARIRREVAPYTTYTSNGREPVTSLGFRYTCNLATKKQTIRVLVWGDSAPVPVPGSHDPTSDLPLVTHSPRAATHCPDPVPDTGSRYSSPGRVRYSRSGRFLETRSRHGPGTGSKTRSLPEVMGSRVR
ncbi:hypothetical protein J6590_012526 [Homalodisca vitripennis]|nr:hypothetical protein J6590_012526 [Homalodisca vitripennis]